MSEQKGFFDANPKMLFVFGLVCGVALTMVIGSAWPGVSSNANGEDTVVDNGGGATGGEEQAILAAITTDDHIRGDLSKAKIVMIEYSDFECSYCGRHNPTVLSLLDAYGDDIALVYRHFPLSFHPEAMPAALASECAADQGKFWEFADAMYENQDLLGDDYYYQLAEENGLDMDTFTTCYENAEHTDDVNEDIQTGSDAGVSGTPATFVNGVLVSGAQPQSVFEGLIDQLLAE